MNSVKLATVLAFSLIASAYSLKSFAETPKSEKKVRVSVTKFTDKTASGAAINSNCHAYNIWADRLGDAFSDVLVEKLEASGKVDVLERETIGDINQGEVNLVNSEEDSSIKKGKFQKARITFVGVVDGFEYCEGGNTVALNVGRLFGVGDITPALKTSSSSVSLVIRAIDTTTGRILATARSKKSQSKRSIALAVELDSIDFAGSDFKQSSLGETIEQAVGDASDQLLKKLKI